MLKPPARSISTRHVSATPSISTSSAVPTAGGDRAPYPTPPARALDDVGRAFRARRSRSRPRADPARLAPRLPDPREILPRVPALRRGRGGEINPGPRPPGPHRPGALAVGSPRPRRVRSGLRPDGRGGPRGVPRAREGLPPRRLPRRRRRRRDDAPTRRRARRGRRVGSSRITVSSRRPVSAGRGPVRVPGGPRLGRVREPVPVPRPAVSPDAVLRDSLPDLVRLARGHRRGRGGDAATRAIGRRSRRARTTRRSTNRRARTRGAWRTTSTSPSDSVPRSAFGG